MAKQSQLDKAIESLKDQRKVIDLALMHLEAQRITRTVTPKPARIRIAKEPGQPAVPPVSAATERAHYDLYNWGNL